MPLSIPNDLKLRTEQLIKLASSEIDQNNLFSQALSLASSNSLIYLSESFSVNSGTPLADPALKSFNSRTIPSFLYQPFENGCGFVFKFSNTDYGYLGSASSTHLWWSVLAADTSYKVLSISQINSVTASYPSYNNWDFNLTSLSFTNSTWTVTGTKIMGPTFSDFEPEAIFAVGYKSMLSPTFSGGTGSIGGVVDGYTYFDYPTIQNRMYVGDLSYQIEIGVTGSIGATGGTNSIVTVGGEGMLVNKMYLGDPTYPLPIGATGGSAFGGTNSVVTVGGSGLMTNKVYLGESTYLDMMTDTYEPVTIGLTTGNDIMGAGVDMKYLYLGHISIVDLIPGDGPTTNACCGKRKPRRRFFYGPGTVGSKLLLRPSGVNSAAEPIFEVPNEYLEITSHATSSQGLSNFIGIHVGALTIGLTESKSVEMLILDQGNPVANWNKPPTVLSFGSYLTSSNDNFYDTVGIDTYAMSTSYLEITPVTYSSVFQNILLSGNWGTESGGTYSTFKVESDAVSVNKLFFGDVNSGQSVYVSGGDLYVNDVVFSGGGSGSAGPQGPVGATGSQGPVGATGNPGPSYVSSSFLGPWMGLPEVYSVEENWVTYGGSTWYTNVGAGDGVPPSPTNSNWTLFAGAALIVGTAIPVSSSSAGSKGEIRVDDGQYLYIHTGAQWLKSSMTFSTF